MFDWWPNDIHLDSCQLLDVVNNSAVHVGIYKQIPVWVLGFNPFGYVPSNNTVGEFLFLMWTDFFELLPTQAMPTKETLHSI